MTAKPEALGCEAVLSELRWLRGLAKGLGADADLADDLSQATVLKALEHPPATDRPIRGWLRTVLRNLFNESRRRKARRESREMRAARGEAGGSTFDVVARAGIQRQVVDAVMALDEPYKTTVLLRFFEDLPPRKIASLTGVPVATVKTRLARALEQLRERLDHAHGGDRNAWLLCLLAPLPKLALGTSATGVLIVQTKLKLVAAAAAVAFIGVGTWFVYDWTKTDVRRETPIDQTTDVAKPKPAAPAETVATAPIRATPYAQLAKDEAGPETATRAASASGVGAPKTGAKIRGKVIDTNSAPVGSVRVVFQPNPGKADAPPQQAVAPALSGPDGFFEMDAPVVLGDLAVRMDGFTTVLTGAWDPRAPGIEPVIVIAPLHEVAGRVVDENHRGITGANVAVELPENFRSGFAHILDYSLTERWQAKSDPDGRFAFRSAPTIPGTTLCVRLEGYEERIDPIVPKASSDLEIVMRRTKAVRDAVAGKVVDHAGVGVAAARVSTGFNTTVTDDSGRFSMKFDPARPPAAVVALKEGFLPASAPVPAASAPAQPIVLKLDGTPLSISGKVVDGDGKPLPGIRVWTPDPTFFATTKGVGIELVENLLAGKKGGRLWSPVETEADGRFVLKGLTPKEYRLHAMDPKTLALQEVGAIAAGSTNVVIEFGGAEMYETVAGIVVSLGGTPVSNAKVRPQIDAFQLSIEGGGITTHHADIEGTTTDAQGRFKLERLPKERVYLRIDGNNVLPVEFGRGVGLETASKGQPLDHLRIEVSVRCHLRIELGDEPDLADEVEVLDPGGRPVPIDVFFGGAGRKTTPMVQISEGRTEVLAVPENAATVVLLKNGKEVERKSIKLVPGSVTIVKP